VKVYIKRHNSGAGKWIYNGYSSAWKSLGYNTIFYDNLEEIEAHGDYYVMALDSNIRESNYEAIENSRKSFVYVQPNRFPMPWGAHPNFISLCPDTIIEKLNNSENVHQWCFGRVTDFHFKWRNVKYIPLAFDSINYKPIEDKKYKFDICFIGGWADNGFNEKRKIMLDYFKEFKDTKIKCGIFINKNISHEQENKILSNSKVALNIHDAYQRVLGLDTNERTFKSLGLTGLLLTDKVEEVTNLLPEVQTVSSPLEMKHTVLTLLAKNREELKAIKEQNRLDILKNHTYINRVKSLLQL